MNYRSHAAMGYDRFCTHLSSYLEPWAVMLMTSTIWNQGTRIRSLLLGEGSLGPRIADYAARSMSRWCCRGQLEEPAGLGSSLEPHTSATHSPGCSLVPWLPPPPHWETHWCCLCTSEACRSQMKACCMPLLCDPQALCCSVDDEVLECRRYIGCCRWYSGSLVCRMYRWRRRSSL